MVVSDAVEAYWRVEIMIYRPILVVDDDPDMRLVVAEILETAGYQVETAADGRDALRSIARVRPSLLVTDLHMPNMDAGQLAEVLHQRGQALPIVVLTGTSRTPEQVARAIGADACLIKPFEPDLLLETVERLRAV
jgi:two-component system response regulator MprA